jgi:hypothetical protein
MKMKDEIISLINNKLNYLNNELEPTYCGEEYYNQWKAENSAQISILEELLEEIKIMN